MLPAATREKVIALLKQYKHVFAWEPADMVGVDRNVIEHNLNVKPGSSTIKQKKRARQMPFGLKNAGATYQRLVDQLFRNQIGRNIEVYVDDMVIKSLEETALITDIEETLKTLEQAKMILNTAKCVFGVEEGHFLGYYVTNQGILPNPAKVQDAFETRSPVTLKEMQSLNGKLTALGRFIAKSAEKALPLFNTLKGEVNKDGFKWTTAADEAWKNLKHALGNLPTLSSPIPGEILSIYLSASHEAVSAVLVVERNNTQLPVYFISRVLQGPEVNYLMLEKLVLALVHAARRLRRYFQAHHVEVLTSQPLKQILLKPENLG
ncbi:hypothetical protein L2E82_04222 [Cichorium intybus]|uniref:Uncharacterized protein n=1 Tax=Cichorium intybus TaxID=13427 RepID=A0ACB9H698_CICIN|nr:hypothetical protein L2E82_04222 [Cichorium intybus]